MNNQSYIESLYREWLQNSSSVDIVWSDYFSNLDKEGVSALTSNSSGALDPQDDHVLAQSRVDSLLRAYREVGYMYCRLNPLGDNTPDHSYIAQEVTREYEKLTLEEFGIPREDLDKVFFAGTSMQPSTGTLRNILESFNQTYCSSIGVEFLHIQDKNMRQWIANRMESTRNHVDLTATQKTKILQDLIQTTELEHFLDSFFIGQKRFSLEGSEALIPGLRFLVDLAAQENIKHIALGATHRGRLSILSTILKMPPEEIFSRFDENYSLGLDGGMGDVKYHIGYDADHIYENGSKVHINLASNPSHLESVGPVVIGKARALIDECESDGKKCVLPVILHGDAAFAGQGVVAETLNLSCLKGYSTGGTIHIVINNQIGFTTPARSGRSTFFPTDVAKMLQVPVFHVNGDDPEALVYVVNLALAFRQKFAADCVIDIFCYRRHGHNEGDEPSFTHPRMYQLIKEHADIASIYGDVCARTGVMSTSDQAAFRTEYHNVLKTALDFSRANPNANSYRSQGDAWDAISPHYSYDPVSTGVAENTLQNLATFLTSTPADIRINTKLTQILEGKRALFFEKKQIDWAFAESLAFGSLVLEKNPVRLSGQDCARGTFSQRHLSWWDISQSNPRSYTPLEHVGKDQATFAVYDSPLSEYSVLGFEYGYSLVSPVGLTIWEAQFGDFSNGGQVIIDTYIVNAETKWHRYSGLVLLLPHGSEGQGPDHSHAHLERFLEMCALENIQVCNPTTPAQYFHLLRRQALSPFKKPLIIMTPKSLLRHPSALSLTGDLTNSVFNMVLDDPWKPTNAKKIVLCSGKVYYDLYAHREKMSASDIALIRIEQLYPFPHARLAHILKNYQGAEDIIWMQEEYKNLGPWSFIREQFSEFFPTLNLRYSGKPPSTSAGLGMLKMHKEEQRIAIETVFENK